MTGNILLSSGFISYLGPFTAGYRIQLVDQWIRMFIENKVPTSKDFQIERILSDEN
jgi:dynein heavy chain, axonemal